MKRWLTILLVNICTFSIAQNKPATDSFYNPVLPGFYPDPSICRVGDDYYMVNSSFEWWPGIPIHHSKDLVNWQQIGHVLNRPSQLTFKNNMRPSAGIWAPTIRYHNGKFYVVVTCMQCVNDCNCGNNFFVTSTSPYGPWSEPVWIDKTYGIDPTIFFDDDGSVWYVGGTQGNKGEDVGGNARWQNEHRIYLQQLDIETGKTFGDKHVLTSGHAGNAMYAESPHIYKVNGKYLLLIAEGGTWRNHAVTGFIADKVTGPYTAMQENPLLTHRHLGNKIDISTTGHADLVQTQNGDWWAVLLGVRDSSGFNQLGRETFLTPVTFRGSIPFFNDGKGRGLIKEKRPKLPWWPVLTTAIRDDFNADSLQLQWNFLRTPITEWYSLTAKKGWLQIDLRPETVKQRVNPSFIARRIQHVNFNATVKLSFTSTKENECAGIVLMQNDSSHYRLEKFNNKIVLYKMQLKQPEQVVAIVDYTAADVVLKCEARGLLLQFYIGATGKDLKPVGDKQDATILSSNKAGGFTGPYIGMYASSNGQPSTAKAFFDWFEYKEVSK